MDVNQVAINWAKRALRFIGQKNQSDGYEEWTTIMKRDMSHLKSLAEANSIMVIRMEDELTATAFTSDSHDDQYIDPSMLDFALNQSYATYYSGPLSEQDKRLVKLLKNPYAFALLPVHEIDVQGCIILTWDSDFDFNDDFKEFIDACLSRIRENIKLPEHIIHWKN